MDVDHFLMTSGICFQFIRLHTNKQNNSSIKSNKALIENTTNLWLKCWKVKKMLG